MRCTTNQDSYIIFVLFPTFPLAFVVVLGDPRRDVLLPHLGV